MGDSGVGSEQDWRGYAETLNHRDGLIDPAAIPRISLNVGAMQQAAAAIKRAGQKVHAAGGAIDHAWQAIGEQYVAPETPQLVSASRLVVRKADDVRDGMAAISDAVSQFAGQMQGVIAALEGVRGEAQAFVDWAIKLGPGGWQDQPVPAWLGGDGGYLLAWQRNQQLAQKAAAILKRAVATEEQYAGPIEVAFGSTFDPPPGKPEPLHSRTEAEDQAQYRLPGWRDINLNAAYDLPWGGMRYTKDDFGQALWGGITFLPALAGFSAEDPQVGHWHWSLKTAGQAWLSMGKMAALFAPTAWAVAPGMNWKTTKTVFPGLVGFDEKGHWSGGRALASATLLVLPTGKLGMASGLAEKGAALAESGGTLARLAGTALKAPGWVGSGKWAGLDVRLLNEYLRNHNAGRVMTGPLDEVALPERLAGRLPTDAASATMPHVDWSSHPANRGQAGRFGTVEEVMAEHRANVAALEHSYRQEVADRGQQFRSDVAVEPRSARQLTEAYRRDVDGLRAVHDRNIAAAEASMRRNLDDVRSGLGLPHTGDYLGDPKGGQALPDVARLHEQRFLESGMPAHEAARKAHELQALYGKRLDQLSSDELALLRRHLGAGTGVTEHTAMSKVLDAKGVEDLLGNNYRGVRGFVAQASAGREALAPVDRFHALALDYKVGHTRPFRLPLHGYGEVVFETAPADVDRYRIPLGGATSEAMSRAASFSGDHLSVVRADPPYTGTGMTAGGVPEFKVDGEVAMRDGAKLYWYLPTRDGRVLQVRLATFEHGGWHVDGVPRTVLGEPGRDPAGRGPAAAAAHEMWRALPEGLRDHLTELAKGGIAFDLSKDEFHEEQGGGDDPGQSDREGGG